MESAAKINQVTEVISYAIIGLAVCIQSWFFFRFKFSADWEVYVILLTYLGAMALRAFLNAQLYSGIDYLNPAAITIIIANLLYFIFEMAYIHCNLASTTLKDYQARKKRIRSTKIFMMAMLLLVYNPLNLIQYQQSGIPRPFLDYVVYSRCISLFIVAVYGFPAFVYYFFYFTVRKLNMLYSVRKSFTCLNKFLIGWILLLWLLKLVYILSLTFFVTYNRLHEDQQLQYSTPYLVLMRPMNFIVDFCIMSTLVYLFYCQGILNEKEQQEKEKSNILIDDLCLTQSTKSTAFHKIRPPPQRTESDYSKNTSCEVMAHTSKASLFYKPTGRMSINEEQEEIDRKSTIGAQDDTIASKSNKSTMFRNYIITKMSLAHT